MHTPARSADGPGRLTRCGPWGLLTPGPVASRPGRLLTPTDIGTKATTFGSFVRSDVKFCISISYVTHQTDFSFI